MTSYYEKPDPASVVEILKVFHAIPGHPVTVHPPIEAFLAGVIGSEPSIIGPLIPLYAEQAENVMLGLARAILMSGREDWKVHIERLKVRWPEHAKTITEIAAKGPQPLSELDPLSHASVIDLNWAYFGATGSARPIARIVTALEGVLETADVNRLMIGYSAKWSIASMAMQNPKVTEICKGLLKGPNRDALEDALKAAEEGKPERIRAEAMAAAKKLPPATVVGKAPGSSISTLSKNKR